ncbi:MAG: uroporphyrinogen decarboxylase family protein [Christensenellales bacterium]
MPEKYAFQPDYMNLVRAAKNEWVARVPLYDHIVDFSKIGEIAGENPASLIFSSDPRDKREGFRIYWDFFRRMGYDAAPFECCITSALVDGGALGAHVKGCIQTRADFERYPWASIEDRFFAQFSGIFRALKDSCPADMRAVGGVGNGVFEIVQDLVGYIDLCYLRADDEELYADLFQRVSDLQCAIWTRFLREYGDAYCVLRFGDDLGFNSSTLLSRDDLRAHVYPCYRRIVEIAHRSAKPLLLHSCGNLLTVFDELIEMTGIDAKHSNEDNIAHFAVWVERFGHRIGNFGGIDMNVICQQDAQSIERYVFDCLDRVAAMPNRGGIAFGSGNSIPDYVPAEGYVAMTEAVRKWRGDRR